MKLDWRTFAAFLQCAPRDSAYAIAKLGETAVWGASEYLLARMSDQLANLQWSISGGRGPRPKPIPRPAAKGDTQTIGRGESWTPVSFMRWLEVMEAD